MPYGKVYKNADRLRNNYNIRVSDTEFATLKEIEQKHGISHTDFVMEALEQYTGTKIFRERTPKGEKPHV